MSASPPLSGSPSMSKPRVPPWCLGLLLLAAAGGGAAWYFSGSRREAETPPAPANDPPAPPAVSDLSLPEPERQYLWEIEHHGNVLVKHGFGAVANALKAADADALLRLLADGF